MHIVQWCLVRDGDQDNIIFEGRTLDGSQIFLFTVTKSRRDVLREISGIVYNASLWYIYCIYFDLLFRRNQNAGGNMVTRIIVVTSVRSVCDRESP